jgi:hypothetical protein
MGRERQGAHRAPAMKGGLGDVSAQAAQLVMDIGLPAAFALVWGSFAVLFRLFG